MRNILFGLSLSVLLFLWCWLVLGGGFFEP